MRVLVAGAGYVGGALARRLAEQRHEVFALKRRPTPLEGAVQGLVADLSRPETLRNLPDCLDAVVYAASPDATTDAAYHSAYVRGIRNLLAALAAQPPRTRRLVLTSSTAVYAQQAGEWVDETSPAQAEHFTGRRVREGEALWLGSGAQAVVLRLGGIYGPGRARLVEAVRRGEATYPPGPPRYVNRNHRDDCARALEHLLTLEAPEPLYLGTDGHPAAQREVVEWLAAALGAPSPQPGPGAPAPRRAETNKRCRSDRLQRTGFRFSYPSFREGYAALIAQSHPL